MSTNAVAEKSKVTEDTEMPDAPNTTNKDEAAKTPESRRSARPSPGEPINSANPSAEDTLPNSVDSDSRRSDTAAPPLPYSRPKAGKGSVAATVYALLP